MTADIAVKAGEQLGRGGGISTVERAAAKLPLPSAPRHARKAPMPPHVAAQEAAAAPVPTQAAAPSPLREERQRQGAAVEGADFPEAATLAQRRRIKIDFARLSAAGMVTPDRPSTRIAEEFRIVKRPLLLNAFAEGERVIRNGNLIMITSARPAEGKTFVSLNLALSLASERNLNVLLVDGDFRNPSLPRRLGFKPDGGLIDVLTGEKSDLSEVLVRCDVPNLTILPAGSDLGQATELLASRRMGSLVEEIAERYNDRVVVFDAPPVLASSEPGVLALHVGQIVFVVEAERTNRQAVEESLALISGCEHISFLLNKRRGWLGMEQFGSYYGYGSPERPAPSRRRNRRGR